jgi:cell division protein FtsW
MPRMSSMRAGHGLLLIVFALLMFGVIMVTSAGLRVDPTHSLQLSDILMGRPMQLAVMAMAAMLIGMTIPLQQVYRARGLASPMPWIVLIAVVLLVHVPGIGREVNAAKRWISLGPIGFQPSEIAKWGLLFVLAWHAARRAGGMGRLFTGFVPPMILVLVICALVGKEDLGTAVLIGTVGVCVLIAGGAKVWHAGLLLPIGGALAVAAIMTSQYRVNRIIAYANPYDDPQGIGYHVIQSMKAVADGGLAGRGLGNSIQKFEYLPEATTDFIFAIICEELGVMGAAVVICLYALLLLCGLSIIMRRTHPFERLLGLGILLTIGFQALINLAVVTGTAPTKGIALPLLSAGGTGWILTAFCIGLIVSMDRATAQEEAAEQDQPLREEVSDAGEMAMGSGAIALAGHDAARRQ